jgi:hypothetical protein
MHPKRRRSALHGGKMRNKQKNAQAVPRFFPHNRGNMPYIKVNGTHLRL